MAFILYLTLTVQRYRALKVHRNDGELCFWQKNEFPLIDIGFFTILSLVLPWNLFLIHCNSLCILWESKSFVREHGAFCNKTLLLLCGNTELFNQ